MKYNWKIKYLESDEILSSKFIINDQETDQAIVDEGIEAIIVNDDIYSSHQNLGKKKNFSVIKSIEKKEIKHRLEKLNKIIKPKVYIKRSIDEEVKEPELHWAALTGMICGILGLFVAGFILGTLGIIFGGIGLNNINKNPDEYKGKGMAVTGLVTGIVAIVVLGLIFAILLS